MSTQVTVLMTTLPDTTSAERLADAVLAAGLAACVTQLAPVRSRYRWQGRVETAEEIPLLFKTSPARADALQQLVLAQHPYETPELLAWDALASPAYGQWVATETGRPLNV